MLIPSVGAIAEVSVSSRLGLTPKTKRAPSDVGDIAEAFVRASFLRQGFNVVSADRSSSSYDLLLEQSGRFLKVQVKSAVLKNGAVVINACRRVGPRGPGERVLYSAKEVDLFAVFCESLMTVYLIPLSDVPKSGVISLRVAPAKNKQISSIRLARDYEFDRIGSI